MITPYSVWKRLNRVAPSPIGGRRLTAILTIQPILRTLLRGEEQVEWQVRPRQADPHMSLPGICGDVQRSASAASWLSLRNWRLVRSFVRSFFCESCNCACRPTLLDDSFWDNRDRPAGKEGKRNFLREKFEIPIRAVPDSDCE